MVPPFLAYYGVTTRNRTMILEAYNQIKLYRIYLRDPGKGMWRHVLLGKSWNDPGFWSTGAFASRLLGSRGLPLLAQATDGPRRVCSAYTQLCKTPNMRLL
jgi:hypothetical protein